MRRKRRSRSESDEGERGAYKGATESDPLPNKQKPGGAHSRGGTRQDAAMRMPGTNGIDVSRQDKRCGSLSASESGQPCVHRGGFASLAASPLGQLVQIDSRLYHYCKPPIESRAPSPLGPAFARQYTVSDALFASGRPSQSLSDALLWLRPAPRQPPCCFAYIVPVVGIEVICTTYCIHHIRPEEVSTPKSLHVKHRVSAALLAAE